jgi:hypothetical protein
LTTTADKEFKGAAVPTTITGTINSVDMACSLALSTGWPTGAQYWGAVIDKGLANEEKVLCYTRSGSNVTIVARGQDNTSASTHTAGATIEHCLFAFDLDALYNHATNTSIDDHTQYLLKTTAASTYETSTHAAATYETTTHAAATYETSTHAASTYAPVATISTANVATNESTTSSSFTDLATAGPAVTVTVPASGKVKVTIHSSLAVTGAGGYAYMGYAVSGANTIAAADTRVLVIGNSGEPNLSASATFLLTGLTPGSTTFTTKYKRIFGTSAGFTNRFIIVETCP